MDLSKISSVEELKRLIVHESLHTLSFSIYQDENLEIEKRGFEIVQENKIEPFSNKDETWDYTRDCHTRLWGISINEGITDILTEEILGTNNRGYELEEDVTRVLFSIIGKENMLKRYFAKIKSKDEINESVKYFFDNILERDYQIIENRSEVKTVVFLQKKTMNISKLFLVFFFVLIA